MMYDIYLTVNIIDRHHGTTSISKISNQSFTADPQKNTRGFAKVSQRFRKSERTRGGLSCRSAKADEQTVECFEAFASKRQKKNPPG